MLPQAAVTTVWSATIAVMSVCSAPSTRIWISAGRVGFSTFAERASLAAPEVSSTAGVRSLAATIEIAITRVGIPVSPVEVSSIRARTTVCTVEVLATGGVIVTAVRAAAVSAPAPSALGIVQFSGAADSDLSAFT